MCLSHGISNSVNSSPKKRPPRVSRPSPLSTVVKVSPVLRDPTSRVPQRELVTELNTRDWVLSHSLAGFLSSRHPDPSLHQI